MGLPTIWKWVGDSSQRGIGPQLFRSNNINNDLYQKKKWLITNLIFSLKKYTITISYSWAYKAN